MPTLRAQRSSHGHFRGGSLIIDLKTEDYREDKILSCPSLLAQLVKSPAIIVMAREISVATAKQASVATAKQASVATAKQASEKASRGKTVNGPKSRAISMIAG